MAHSSKVDVVFTDRRADHGIAAPGIGGFDSVHNGHPWGEPFESPGGTIGNLGIHDEHAIHVMIENKMQKTSDHVSRFKEIR